jgi:ubiquinone/menaquinone biosynthesis C-methylase UbiE
MNFEERFVFNGQDNGDIILNEHLVRYQLASQFVKDKKVLDIACGSGYGSKILALAGASEVIGMDKDAAAVKAAQPLAVANLVYKEGDAEKIEAADKEFGVVVSFETVEHLHNQEAYVAELGRVVSDDGLVFVSTPNKEVFGNKNPFHIKELTKAEFEALLKKVFPFVVCFEQENAVCSLLKLAGENSIGATSISSSGQPLYFLAVCSKKEIAEKDFYGQGRASASAKVFNRIKNNPVLKLSDKIYPLIARFLKK